MLPRRTIPPILAAALAVGTAVIGYASRAEDRLPVDRIIAIVGSEIILLSEARERAAPRLEELRKAASQGGGELMLEQRGGKILAETLNQMIDERLVTQQARVMKITVETVEVETAIANMAAENGVDLQTFERALEARGKDMTTYRADMRRDLLMFKVLNLRIRGRVKVSEDEARQYYNNQVRDVRATGTFEGAHILVRVPDDARPSEVAKLRRHVEGLRARIEGGEEFAEVAKQESEDKVTGARGGKLGRLKSGELPKVLDRAFLDLEDGELAGPLRSSSGFHIINLIERQALGVQPFAEVKNRIVGQLMQEEMVRQQKIWLRELRLRTFVDIRL
ncbi:MAG: peptidylprolyl isomerase [Deltaproteobacteria bacterium]|nr:peptidylprolyl isomerase [Deltaproteobacteria bacterium]